MSNKILMAWKPRFMTSHDCLQVLKRKHGFKKLGHTGTLDPLACGLMGILADEATKFQSDLQKTSKTYIGKIKLGVVTDSWDSLGIPEVVSKIPSQIDMLTLEKHIKSLTEMMPPKVSAIKIDGKKALETKLTNEDMKMRPFVCHDLKLKIISGYEISILAEVGGGTYIRGIAYEIGKLLGCGAFLSELIRVSHHGFEKHGSIFDPCDIVGEVKL